LQVTNSSMRRSLLLTAVAVTATFVLLIHAGQSTRTAPCVKEGGIKYDNPFNACQECICKKGIVTCVTKKCKVLKCAKKRKQPGGCCLECVDSAVKPLNSAGTQKVRRQFDDFDDDDEDIDIMGNSLEEVHTTMRPRPKPKPRRLNIRHMERQMDDDTQGQRVYSAADAASLAGSQKVRRQFDDFDDDDEDIDIMGNSLEEVHTTMRPRPKPKPRRLNIRHMER